MGFTTETRHVHTTWLTPYPCPTADWPRLVTPTFETRPLFLGHSKSLAVFSIQGIHRCPTASFRANIEQLDSVFIKAALASRVSGFEIFQLYACSHSSFEQTRLTTMATPGICVISWIATNCDVRSPLLYLSDLDAGQFGEQKPMLLACTSRAAIALALPRASLLAMAAAT